MKLKNKNLTSDFSPKELAPAFVKFGSPDPRAGFKEVKPPGRRGVRTVFPYSHSNSIPGCSPSMEQWAFLVIATDDTLWNYNGNWTQIPVPQP